MISRELLLEIFRLWQKGADAHRNTESCDVCKNARPTRRVGKKYWVCAQCTQKFLMWENDERDKALEAARTLIEMATRKE